MHTQNNCYVDSHGCIHGSSLSISGAELFNVFLLLSPIWLGPVASCKQRATSERHMCARGAVHFTWWLSREIKVQNPWHSTALDILVLNARSWRHRAASYVVRELWALTCVNMNRIFMHLMSRSFLIFVDDLIIRLLGYFVFFSVIRCSCLKRATRETTQGFVRGRDTKL